MNEKEFWEFMKKALAKGRVPQVSYSVDIGNSKMKKTGGYLNGHSILPKDYNKISKEKIVRMGKLLLDKNVSHRTKETILIILAHHSSKEALNALKAYNKNSDKGLEIFAEIALDECYMWQD